MVATEPDRLRQAHRAFRRGRIKLACSGAFAAAGLTLLAWLMGCDGMSVWFGASLMILVFASRYVGRTPGRAVLPALVIGLVPFFSMAAVRTATGHDCDSAQCASVWLATSVVSGLAALPRLSRG